MASVIGVYERSVNWLNGALPEALILLFVRIALAGVFWRSGRSKIADDSWLTISDTTYALFATEYAGVPLPPELAAVAATGAEHVLPALLILGLFTRMSAAGLLAMTMVIQIFVYPDAWWPVHALWAAMAAVLIVRGGGTFSLDRLIGARLRR